jgi:hypothetical protein
MKVLDELYQGLLPDQLHPPLLRQLDTVAGGLYASGKDAKHLASLSAFLFYLILRSYVTFCIKILNGRFQGLLPDQLLSLVLPQLDAVAGGLCASGKCAKTFCVTLSFSFYIVLRFLFHVLYRNSGCAVSRTTSRPAAFPDSSSARYCGWRSLCCR